MLFLSVGEEMPCFFLQENKMFTIFHVLHLLKALRNAILNYTFIIREQAVKIEYIRQFITLDMQMQPRLAKCCC